MRLLHCGDIHLDSRFTSYLSEEKAAERRGELMQAFKSMLKLGSQKKVDGVIIAGDLFDSDNSSRFTRDIVLSEIRQHSEMTFFYLRGNHDKGFETGELPENLCLFGDEWTKYAFKTRGRRIVIAGAEAGKRGVTQLARELKLKQNDINVVVLHGQTRDYEGGNDLQTIPLSLLKDKNIDSVGIAPVDTYDSLKKFCKIKCLICGKVYTKPRAEGFLSSWKCCEGNNESKIELIKRLCNESGEYQFIKQLDALHIVIKHLKCGNELTKSVQSAISSPCSCPICNTQSQKLRITLQDAQK